MNNQVPLIIECRCNEITMRGDNPALPYSSKEIIKEAVRAWEAGASIFHWHGRDPETGKPRNDVELYLEVIQGIREQTDLLTGIHINLVVTIKLFCCGVPKIYVKGAKIYWCHIHP